MNDQTSTLPGDSAVSVSTAAAASTPSVAGSDPMVDQVVAQAGSIQDLFVGNDQGAGSANPVSDDPQVVGDSNAQSLDSAADSSDTASADGLASQRSAEPAASSSVSDGGQQLDAAADAVSPMSPDLGDESPTEAPADAAGEDAGKSPLDILEEILGKQKEESAAADGPPKEPELTPEQIAAIEAQKAAEAAAVEAHRLKLIEEARSGEQQQRDQIREEQAESLKVVSEHDVKQLERKKVYVGQ